MNKKAQGMPLTTIILIVLGLVVLIFLIYGFSTGWANLWDRITQYTGGESNVDTVKSACVLACATNSKQQFCDLKRPVRFGDGYTATATCKELVGNVEFAKGEVNETKTIGVEDCSGLC